MAIRFEGNSSISWGQKSVTINFPAVCNYRYQTSHLGTLKCQLWNISSPMPSASTHHVMAERSYGQCYGNYKYNPFAETFKVLEDSSEDYYALVLLEYQDNTFKYIHYINYGAMTRPVNKKHYDVIVPAQGAQYQAKQKQKNSDLIVFPQVDEVKKSNDLQGSTNPQIQEKSNDQKYCSVCLDNPRNCVNLNCGHLSCCVSCGQDIDKCPICRTPMKAMKVFV